MAPRSNDNRDKIADERLRDFLISGTSGKVSVILEVDAPEPTVEYRGKRNEGAAGLHPHAVSFSEKAEGIERRAIEETRSLLKSMQVECRFLRSARVFSVRVTADQLRQIVAAPTIRAAIPNRRVGLAH